MPADFAWRIVDIIFFINLFLVLAVVVFERRNPTATLAWILLLVFMPVIGFIFYVFLGQSCARRRFFTLRKKKNRNCYLSWPSRKPVYTPTAWSAVIPELRNTRTSSTCS